MSDFTIARQKMVDGQVRPSDVTDRWVIEAMLAVPREVFVPDHQTSMAYLDLDIKVSGDATQPRFLIKPVVIARLLQAAEIKPTDNVMVVGCATGYTAALIARLCGRVTATESDPSVAQMAQGALSRLGGGPVDLKTAPASDGCAERGPFDVIVLDGATEVEPRSLYRQLAEGGRLVGVFATTRPSRAVIVTHAQDDYGTRALFDATIPTLPGLERAEAFVF